MSRNDNFATEEHVQILTSRASMFTRFVGSANPFTDTSTTAGFKIVGVKMIEVGYKYIWTKNARLKDHLFLVIR